MSPKRFDAAITLRARSQWSSTQMLPLTSMTHTASPGRREGSRAPRGRCPLRRRPVSDASCCIEHAHRNVVRVSTPCFAPTMAFTLALSSIAPAIPSGRFA